MNGSNFGRGSDFSRNMKGPKAQPEVAGSINRQNGTYGFDTSGKMISSFEGKMLLLTTLLVIPGILYSLYIMYSKSTDKDGVKDYTYDSMSRSKAEKMASFALILAIIYAFIIWFNTNAVDAKRLDEIYKQEQLEKRRN